jgi:hypothetical protein
MSTACDYLAAVQQRADAATDGPWTFEVHRFKTTVDAVTTHPISGLSIPFSPVPSVIGEENAEFIAASRTDVPRLVAALIAALDVHEPVNALLNPGPHERVVKVCTGCGTDDGNWQRWPCPTVRVITDALTPKENDS